MLRTQPRNRETAADKKQPASQGISYLQRTAAMTMCRAQQARPVPSKRLCTGQDSVFPKRLMCLREEETPLSTTYRHLARALLECASYPEPSPTLGVQRRCLSCGQQSATEESGIKSPRPSMHSLSNPNALSITTALFVSLIPARSAFPAHVVLTVQSYIFIFRFQFSNLLFALFHVSALLYTVCPILRSPAGSALICMPKPLPFVICPIYNLDILRCTDFLFSLFAFFLKDLDYKPAAGRGARQSSAAGEMQTLTPQVYWAQRHEDIYLRVELSDVKDTEVTLKENILHFRAQGHGAKGENEYQFSLEFLDLVRDKPVCKTTERQVNITVKKVEPCWWERLTKQERKPLFLSPDFDRWQEESDAEMELRAEVD
ncbi:HACD3 dehydratase, partial [Polypterus senegalus]